MTLPERQRLILKEIVDRYIRRREPVSSRMILEEYGLSVSSATVRNDMNDLEAGGYIEKPYSSSGRIPTKTGYRFFVDWLLDLSELTRKECSEIVEAYELPYLEVGETMRQTAFLLGSITGHAAFVIPPRWAETRLDRVVLVRMEERRLLLVLASDIGIIEHGMIELEEPISVDETRRVSDVINESLRGVSLDAVRQLTLEEGPEGWYERPVRQAMMVLRHLLERLLKQRLHLEGILNLVDSLQQVSPERALERLVALMHAVQDEAQFGASIRNARKEPLGLSVCVGDCPMTGLEDYSIVSATYGSHDGVLGVIAPVWMDYGKAISATSYIGNRLEALLTTASRSTQEFK